MIFGQIAAGVGIIAAAYVAFYKQGFKFEVSTLVKVSFLVLISFLLGLFSWFMPILGFPAVKIGFEQVPLLIIGFLYGPSWAFLGGFSSDLISLMSGTITTPFFGFTLNKILVAMIPALLIRYKKKASLTEIIALVSAISLGAMAYIFTRDTVKISDVLIPVDSMSKVLVSIGILVLSGLLIFSIYKITKKEVNDQTYLWVLSALLVEVCVNMTLTPIWLYAMYGLPISISIMVRLIKTVIMVPLVTFIGLVSLKVLSKVKA